MTINLKYHEIFEEELVVEMEQLKEEFELLFTSKNGDYTSTDKKIANNLLNYVLENTDIHDSYLLLHILEETTSNIEDSYPLLFT